MTINCNILYLILWIIIHLLIQFNASLTITCEDKTNQLFLCFTQKSYIL